ncbi:hypothetical protein TRIATDRAFT_302951 [Trichoderma atroviride IMI 206040]|uniref:Uncharacterized protein n=1 Tax=Hypocrea atroviridis (strain ATCC 20476 / IMI 206040) TaxID=452589 RepID=G9PB59_HYPAI|nr:uncharacterized protein TRIATDRAFT_302951 [Trichoderma atroviride IMI 206040]EHK39608.1 hypothetical protein TRIATDRAFT_302951 [Trichoderma atroviride IMI 206040]
MSAAAALHQHALPDWEVILGDAASYSTLLRSGPTTSVRSSGCPALGRCWSVLPAFSCLSFYCTAYLTSFHALRFVYAGTAPSRGGSPRPRLCW